MAGSYVCKEKQKGNSPERHAEAKTQKPLSAGLRNLHPTYANDLMTFYSISTLHHLHRVPSKWHED